MVEKLRQNANKGLAGQVPSITAKRTSQMPSEDSSHPMHKIRRALNDEENLDYVRESLEFLDSMSLFHCWNCDEEWPVFSKEWPQAGIQYAGPKAGKSEVLEKHGFQSCPTHLDFCTRCSQRKTYLLMFCNAIWQHLGPRHPALSALTWYESQLIARVHAVMSVLTLTATGMLCFAGHVCNYYQKILEWHHALPAVLRDKQFFVVKRRRSLRAPGVSQKQKKPTTANRKRLTDAIVEAVTFMPTVYAHSWIDVTHLNKVTHEDAGMEKEPDDDNFQLAADLSNDVCLRFDVFEKWMGAAIRLPFEFPCGAVIWNTAKDAQTEDLRCTDADTTWEFCCRMLSQNAVTTVLRTSHLSMMIYHWHELAIQQDMSDVPDSDPIKAIFGGMDEDTTQRLVTAVTDKDKDAMRTRWVRQSARRA